MWKGVCVSGVQLPLTDRLLSADLEEHRSEQVCHPLPLLELVFWLEVSV
ncbi:hypothetical protein GDO81_019517 [Engystomops pustulosus]|uniref:Uncharacterized protein n=1 Tax=Engystomops pustulosus TaxID=76066 RepID=A0AAV6YZ52_ENGPU|nr:hypothetical protein GDO81_019517 [Engystomops pustulosus]